MPMDWAASLSSATARNETPIRVLLKTIDNATTSAMAMPEANRSN